MNGLNSKNRNSALAVPPVRFRYSPVLLRYIVRDSGIIGTCQCPNCSPNSVAPATPMSLTIAPSAGAVVIEASTNLVDWTDVTMLFPSDGAGLFLDTQSTNYGFRFYRIRSILSAANNLVTVNT